MITYWNLDDSITIDQRGWTVAKWNNNMGGRNATGCSRWDIWKTRR